ncbi:uncharacterized protein CEXT_561161 [Caerostris extrusa]|uniref:Uncharacterized protein n=1 Tax=Caerostris extrusa TaxID=172846 RepID=A0AAV4SZT5_CAEEX|nr:uncharacterized protein CEXT_561161 [Caerostris extrusa]
MHEAQEKRLELTNGHMRTKCLTLQQWLSKNLKQGNLAWKAFKCIIFLTCLACFWHQSLLFYVHYNMFPTTTSFAVVTPDAFKMPAITFCTRNPIQRSKFCADYPYLCDRPINEQEFCSKHPHFCKENPRYLKIPKLLYFTRNLESKIRTITNDLLLNFSEDPLNLFIKTDNEMKITLVRDAKTFNFAKCYSANLHLKE